MGDLRELNQAAQNATFPGVKFAQAVREVLEEVVERIENGVQLKWVEHWEWFSFNRKGWISLEITSGDYVLMASPPPLGEPKQDEKFDGGAA